MDISDIKEEGIAVVGMSCRFPGAGNLKEYWANLCQGRVSVAFLDDGELSAEGVADELLHDPSYVKAGYFLEDIDKFDAAFFGYAGSEAAKIDPQQRLFLETCWEALEDAGCSPLPGGRLQGRSVGVFAGSRMSTYFSHLYRGLKPGKSADAFQSLVGNDKDYLCSRVSYKLNLHGPSLGIQSACSSSLSAVHFACESLRSGACDLALAGGVAVNVPQKSGYLYQQGMIMSPDGYCRPFDRNASGTVFSNGVGVVALKRLEDALADGDRIYCAVLASVVNNDGAQRVGYTAPGEAGQTSVIGEALELSGLSAEDIGFVETHGTGTAIGDPIEFASLNKVFTHFTKRKGFCALGAVKANIGHADAASGIASFIKACMAVHEGKIPPHPLFTEANPAIALDASPFYINTELKEWRPEGSLRFAGISSFGIGGSNAHAILAEVPAPPAERPQAEAIDVFALSSRTPAMLRALAGRTAESIASAKPRLMDLCRTARESRSQDRCRLALAVRGRDALASALAEFAAGGAPEGLVTGEALPGRKAPPQPFEMADFSAQSLARACQAYAAGDDSALAPLQERGLDMGARLWPLPATPFERRRCWFDEDAMEEGAEAPGMARLKGRALQTAFSAPGGRLLFQGRLAGGDLERMKQHRLHGRAVAPASLFLDLMMQAARQLHPEGCSLASCAVVRPLVIGDADAVFFQIGVQDEAVELYASLEPMNAASWTLHARAECAPAARLAPGADGESVLPFREGAGQEGFSKEAYYAVFEQAGVGYGPAFRNIAGQAQAEGGAFVLVKLPRELRGKGWAFGPEALDACLQAFPAAVPPELLGQGRCFVPAACRKLALADMPAGLPETLCVKAKLAAGVEPGADAVDLDIDVFGQDGAPLARIAGLRMAPVSARALDQQAAGKAPSLCYGLAWRELKDMSCAPKDGDRFIFIEDQGGLAARLAMRFSVLGRACVSLPSAEGQPFREALDEALKGRGDVFIGDFRPLDFRAEAGFRANAESCLGDLFAVMRAVNAGNAKRLRFTLATAGAFGPGAASGLPEEAMFWGIVPVLATEYPECRVRVVDVEKAEEIPAGFAEAFLCDLPESRLAVRQGLVYAPRLVPAPLEPAEQDGGTAKALVMEGSGLDSLAMVSEARRKPGPGEVEVAICASSLNFRDVMMAMGIYPGDRTAIGSDAAGLVAAVGEGVEGFSEGDRVAVSAFGCIRSHVTLDASMVRKIPEGIGMEEAAGLPVAYITAWYSLVELGRIKPGQTVLVHAASGGVGLAALSIARHFGATVIGTAGSDAKRAFVLKRGASFCFSSRSADFAREVEKATGGRGVDIVLNSLAGEPQQASFDIVADGGSFIELGKSGVLDKGECKGAKGVMHYYPVDLVVLGREEPEVMARAFTQSLEACGRGELDLLPVKAFPVAGYPEAFRFMAGARHIGKIVLTWPSAGLAQDAGPQPGETEFISGGLGGLGLKLAARRVRQGCRHLVLAARHAPDDAAKAVLESLARAGCEVKAIACDVSDYEALKGALLGALEGMPKLARIWHLAGVLDDGRFSSLDASRFMKVLAPKAEGALNLDRLSREEPWAADLRSFVLFSSTAAWFGTPGQASYAAANAVLDALAARRRAEGLPALAVNWGAFGEAGMAARGAGLASLKAFGIGAMAPEQGFALLDSLLAQGRSSAAVCDIAWPAYRKAHGLLPVAALFDEVMAAGCAAGKGAEAGEPRRDGARADAGKVAARLKEKVCGILKAGPDEVDGQANLIELGIDSLLALDLFQSMEKDFGVRLERSLLFENPTLDALTARVVELVCGGAADGGEEHAQIVPNAVERFAPFQLMDMQQAYWVGRTGALVLGNVSCHVYLELESADLDVQRLRTAWNRLIRQHDMLRCVIMADGRQRILPDVPDLEIPFDDFSDLPRGEADRRVLARREAMSHEVLAGSQWPLYRVAVTKIAAGSFRMHVSLDLLVADLHSMNLIMEGLAELYAHPETELKPLELSFRDYVLALDGFRQSARYGRDRAYWMDRVNALAPAPDLPLAVSPSQIERPRFVRHQATLDRATWERLKQKAAKADLTVSGFLLSAYAEVLARWSSRPDFTINVTLFNRLPLHPDVPKVVGDFTSVSLLSCRLDEEMNFISRSKNLQKQLWADMDHSTFSGVETIREWVKATGRSSADIIPIVFTSTIGMGGENDTHPALRTFGRIVYNITQTPQVWIDHQVREVEGCLDFNWDAVDELFPEGMVDDMFASYCRLLRILAEDDRVWSYTRLPLLPQDQLVRRREANATFTAWDSPVRTLDGFFAASLARTPDALALVDGEKRLSYRELGRRAEALARALVKAGAKPGDKIAVVSDGGCEETVSALAATSLGCAYMPIDAAVPPARLAYLLEYSGARAVCTQTRHKALAFPAGLPVIFADEASLEDAGDFDLERAVSRPGDLAYVIHTSGSTGTPKGVMIRHEGACNTIHAVNRLVGLTAEDRVLALSRFTFDLSVWDIFGLLGAGGALVLPDPKQRLETAHWLRLMADNGVTVWNTVPPLMQMMAGQAEREARGSLPPLRTALLSGDWIPLSLPRRVHGLWPGLRLVGLGGATEASIWSNYYVIDAVKPEWKSIPYGRPLANQQFHVLNRLGTDCPDGVPGELYIAGDGLAQGYLNDPEKTAKSFILHPGTGEPLYATGDLGRYMKDGCIEFLGRQDSQVKINGYRIELGEIENALMEHPAVGHASVIPVQGQQAGRALAAFACPKQGQAKPAAAELKQWLEERLPPYLVPGMVIVKDSLPLTPSGKVDRKSLAVDPAEFETQAPVVKPRTEMESLVASTLAAVLGRDSVSIETRFFEMGLSSLDLVTVQARLQERIGMQVPLMTLLEHTTIRSLAAFLSQSAGASKMKNVNARASGASAPGAAPSFKRGASRAERRLAHRRGRPGPSQGQEAKSNDPSRKGGSF